MTREEAERYGKVLAELEYFRKKKKVQLSDIVRGSSPEFPYTDHPIKIEGADPDSYDREMQLIREKYEEKGRLESELLSVSDPEMQQILWMYYVHGKTQDEIARELGYDQKTISNRISAFFDKNEKVS